MPSASGLSHTPILVQRLFGAIVRIATACATSYAKYWLKRLADAPTIGFQSTFELPKSQGRICGVLALSSVAAKAVSSATVWHPRAHIAELDGVRGLAILLVTLYRFGKYTPKDTTLGYCLATLFDCGQNGVELFFVLSGFLITGILLESRNDSRYLSNFMARRALRIFPLYFATLAIVLVVVPAIAALLHVPYPYEQAQSQQLYLWSYSTNIAMSINDSWMFGWLDHFWSLAVEEHFYLVWPLVVLLLTTRQLLWISLAGAMIAIVSRTVWQWLGFNATAPMVLTLFRCDGLLIGAAMAVLMRDPGSLATVGEALRHWIDCCARKAWLPALIVAIAIDLSGRRVFMLGETLWMVAWSSLLWNIMRAPRNSWQSSLFQLAPLRFLGKISYGMYVFQNPLIPLLAPLLLTLGIHFATEGRVIEHLMCMAIMCTMTGVCAWISWHAFERHWLRWKVRFEPQGKAAPSEEPGCNLPTTMLGIRG